MSPEASPRKRSLIWVYALFLALVVGVALSFLLLRKHGTASGRAPRPPVVQRSPLSLKLSPGYEQIALEVERPEETRVRGTPGDVRRAPGGLSRELNSAFSSQPLLADSYSAMRAATIEGSSSYGIQVKAALPDNKRSIVGAVLIRKGVELTILPLFEKLDPSLQARWRECILLISIPRDALPVGQYHATLVGAQSSLSWTLNIRQ